jgi:hypothetical protein
MGLFVGMDVKFGGRHGVKGKGDLVLSFGG